MKIIKDQDTEVSYEKLEKYFDELKSKDHPKNFSPTQDADPTLYCYGRNGEKCPFLPPDNADIDEPLTQLSNRAVVHYNGCCLDCCKSSNQFGICPCKLHLDIASSRFCFGSKDAPCNTFKQTGELQPIHSFKMCIECAKHYNGGYCICPDCTGTGVRIDAGLICYGTNLYECVNYTNNHVRKIYKKQLTGFVCSACNTLWKQLLQFKNRPKSETITKNGISVKKARLYTDDPPPVTFRIDMNIQNLNSKAPQRHIPSIPIPAVLNIQFTPTSIHPWYLIPIRQCLICRTVHAPLFYHIVNKFDLCSACYTLWHTYLKNLESTDWKFQREVRQGFIVPMQDLEDIIQSYNIPSGEFKIIFLWARNSETYTEPASECYKLDFLLKCNSKNVLAGSGRTYIVPDKYYKSGAANTTLISCDPFQDYPNWGNLCLDINCILNSRTQVTANIIINRMDELSTSPFHLRNALARLEHPTPNPNQSGTCVVSDFVELLDSRVDFSKLDTVAGLCLNSCFKKEHFTGIQPTDVYGSSVIPDTFNEQGMEDISMTVQNQSDFLPPRLFTLNGFIEAETVKGNSDTFVSKDENVELGIMFTSNPQSRKPKSKENGIKNEKDQVVF
ncbi:hypothetical protein HDV02_006591 [Globomyces sp. JEL0801]|nr:hypothetical protein HDV02_006591 [Globomyces sp. JEL0801]